MPAVPAVTPDGAKIRKLIRDGGWSIPGFTRRLKNPKRGPRTIYNVVNNNQRVSVELGRQIARALGVPFEEIVLAEDEAA